MLYTKDTYKTKKAFIEAVKNGKVEVYGYNPTQRGAVANPTGRETVCGPGEYERRWFAAVEVEDGVVRRVIS